MASRSLSDLDPIARELCMKWIGACHTEGIDVLVYCTYRDEAEQNSLYAEGRTKPGKISTNAKGGESFHQYRCAWDCVPVVNGKAQWGAKDTYKRMGELAKQFGIEWAGEWVSFKETAHFQVTKGMKLADFKAGKTLSLIA